MRDDIYFCLELTEEEHNFTEGMLSVLCMLCGMELVYYRKVKTGHIPMIREVKVRFGKESGHFFKFMRVNQLWKHAKRWQDGKLVGWTEQQGEF